MSRVFNVTSHEVIVMTGFPDFSDTEISTEMLESEIYLMKKGQFHG